MDREKEEEEISKITINAVSINNIVSNTWSETILALNVDAILTKYYIPECLCI